jgi:hypothetical protein
MIPVLSLAQVAREDTVIFDTSRTPKDPTNFNIKNKFPKKLLT